MVLGSLLILAGAYYGSTIWLKNKNQSASQSSPSPRLGNLESSELVKMEFPDITLEKSVDAWELKSYMGETPPPEFELDQNQILSLTYSLASIWIDSIVDEDPPDLSVYGLEYPFSRAAVTDSAGTRAEYILGDMTPSRSTYYVMEKGDPKVYSVSAYLAENMNVSLDKLRQRSLFPVFQFNELKRLSVELKETLIEVMERPETVRPYLASIYTNHILASPYKLMRGVSNEALSKLLAPLSNLRIEDFIDDHPSSLQPYGLDKPVRIFIQTADKTLALLIGSEAEGKFYAKLDNAPDKASVETLRLTQGVFTISGIESVINIRPFDLINKFALLVNIDQVDKLKISGGEKDLIADLQRHDEDETFFLNGEKAQTRAFKIFYESVVGLMADAEYPQTAALIPAQNTEGGGNITIEYWLNTPPGERLSITLVPYNRDFYSLLQEGTTEFLISRDQVSKIFTKADEMVFE